MSSSSSPQRRHLRGNGSFQLPTHAISKCETPEKECALTHKVERSSQWWADAKILACATPLRRSSRIDSRYVATGTADASILVDTSGDSDDNNNDDTDDDDIVVFYRRYDGDTPEVENNREVSDMQLESVDYPLAACRQRRTRSFVHSEVSSPLRLPVEALNNQLSIEPLHPLVTESYERTSMSRRTSICCELRVHYEMFDSVTKSQQCERVLSRFTQCVATQQLQPSPLSPLPPLAMTTMQSIFSRSYRCSDDDDDVMNICSPVAQRSAVGSDRSALTHRDQQPEDDYDATATQQHQIQTQDVGRRSWTSEQYNDMLGYLQQACATQSTEIAIPGERLAQMEQLLRALHPSASE